MSRTAHFAIPGDIDAPTGGYAYARHLIRALPACGWSVSVVTLPGRYPSPDANDIAETERRFAPIPHGDPLLIDGLALGAMPPDLVAALPQPIAALVHHPLGLESGLPIDRKHDLIANERAVLRHADRVIATSETTAATLAADFAVPETKLRVAEPGVTRTARAASRVTAAGSDQLLRVLAVGAVSERKGYDVLIEALSGLKATPWHLTVVGDLDRAPDVTARLHNMISDTGLADR
ncbi:MAG: glycosyltransferase, partial [Pseudomonadota bacterium]